MCSKGICTQVSIEDRSASRLTLSWDLSWYSVNTTTSQSTAGWESTNYSTHHQVPTDTWVSPHLANYQPTVDQIDAERESIKCQSSVNQGSNKMSIKCQSNVHQRSNARMRICVPITHMIPKKNTKQDRVIFFSHADVALTSSSSFLKFWAGKRLPFPRKNPVLPRNPLSPNIPSVRSLCSFQLYTVKSASNSAYLKDNVPAG